MVILPKRVFGWEKDEKGAEDLREARHGRPEKEDRRRTTEGGRQRNQKNKEERGEEERRRKRRRERPHYHAARTSLTTRDPSESFLVGSTRHLDAEPSQSDGFFKPLLMSVSCFFFL